MGGGGTDRYRLDVMNFESDMLFTVVEAATDMGEPNVSPGRRSDWLLSGRMLNWIVTL